MAKRASLVLLLVAMLRPEALCAQTELDKKPIKPGEKGSVTLHVDGTAKPVRVHVRNRTIDIVSVKGGNDQYVMSSGGEKNVVKLELLGLKPGNPSFSMEVDARDLDTIFRQTLRQVIENTRKRAAALESIRTPSGRRIYKTDDVIAVLHQIQSDVGAAMPEHEFAPFRDAVEDYVATLEQRVREAIVVSPSNTSRRDGRAIVVVSYRTVADVRGVDKEAADSIFGEFFRLFDGTAERGSTRELCIQTTPTDYQITITPRSYPPDAQTVTTASLLTVLIGKYKVHIDAKGTSMESDSTLDLLRNPESVIRCPVKFKSGDAEACQFLEGNARPCQ